MKYKVFIGSSSEHIDYAEAVQIRLSYEKDFAPICWSQGVFKPANYPLEDLLIQLGKMSFGIFVLAPDDFVEQRGKKYATVRDNVLFEMGLYYGALGRCRTFFIAPKKAEGDLEFRIPSDLTGINYEEYTLSSSLEDIDSMIGPACSKIIRRMKEELLYSTPRDIIEKYGIFSDFDDTSRRLFGKAKHITTYFIHSRRWRETFLTSIEHFQKKEGTFWEIILPDVREDTTFQLIKKHFSDGKTMLQKVLDAYEFCVQYKGKYPDKMEIYLCPFYPTYSFYKFDNKMIVSMYPLTDVRRSTPTFLIDLKSDASTFFLDDIEDLKTKSKNVSVDELSGIIDSYIK